MFDELQLRCDLRDLVVCLPDGLPQLAALTRDACGDRARRVMGLTQGRARGGYPLPSMLGDSKHEGL